MDDLAGKGRGRHGCGQRHRSGHRRALRRRGHDASSSPTSRSRRSSETAAELADRRTRTCRGGPHRRHRRRRRGRPRPTRRRALRRRPRRVQQRRRRHARADLGADARRLALGASASTCGAWSTASGPSCPMLLAQGEPGHVVNTASIAGLVPSPTIAPVQRGQGRRRRRCPRPSTWSCAELGAPIGVSVLCPGVVPTRIAAQRPQPSGRRPTGPARHPDPGRAAADGPDGRADRRHGSSTPSSATEFWIVTHEGSADADRAARRRP